MREEEGLSTTKIDVLSSLLQHVIDDFMELITEHTGSSRSFAGLIHEVKNEKEFEIWARFWLETQLVPSVLAIACGVYELHSGKNTLLDASILNQRMPELINCLRAAPLPAESEFLERISKAVDPDRWAAMKRNLGPRGAQSPGVEAFNNMLHQIFE